MSFTFLHHPPSLCVRYSPLANTDPNYLPKPIALPLLLCFCTKIVSLRSTCKHKLATVVAVARRGQTSGMDVVKMSCRTESGSADILLAASGILGTCRYWSIPQGMQEKKETTQVLFTSTFAEISRWRVTRLEDVCVAHSYTLVHHALHTCTDTAIFINMEYNLGQIFHI